MLYMSKVIESPVKRFKGTVTLRDPMTFDLVAKWEEALQVIQTADKESRFAVIQRTLYPLMIGMVETWELTNIISPVTVENFPNASAGTSAASIHHLTAWLINECQKIYNGNEDSDPNE